MIVTDPYQPDPEKYPGGAVFGNAVRERRLAAGLTLRACAELVGISMADLSAVEQGQRAFSVQEWFCFGRVCKGLGWIVIHGDSRSVLKDIPSGSVDCIITDPPYGHNNNDGDLIQNIERAMPARASKSGRDGIARPIANDGPEANEMFREVLPDFNRVISPGCCCCCCCGGGGGPDPQFARWSLWLDEAIGFKQMVVWDKGPMGMGWHYRRSYETVLVAEKPGAACRWYDETSRIENVIRPGAWGIRKIIPQADDHPTPKPPELAAHFIALHTKPGDTVLDPFAGHGWVGEAALRMGRNFIGIELDAGFVKVATNRCAEAANHLFSGIQQ